MLIFYQFALLLVSLLSMSTKFIVNYGDQIRGSPWEQRSTFFFYFDFVIDTLKLIVYTAFFFTVVAYYGVPLHIIRDLYLTIRSFLLKVKDIIRYRRATANMNERYPDATQEEISRSDRICIICREEMRDAKKLPCGHLFHFRCLRSWLERQQACPTCRRSIFEEPPASPQENNDRDSSTPADANVQESTHSEIPTDSAQEDSSYHQDSLPVIYIPPDLVEARINRASGEAASISSGEYKLKAVSCNPKS